MDKIKVLLVEDEPMLAMIIKDTLDNEGFEIVLAADGEEGLSMYKKQHPDIIVTDIMMPRMDGFTMVKRIPQEERRRSSANRKFSGKCDRALIFLNFKNG